MQFQEKDKKKAAKIQVSRLLYAIKLKILN